MMKQDKTPQDIFDLTEEEFNKYFMSTIYSQILNSWQDVLFPLLFSAIVLLGLCAVLISLNNNFFYFGFILWGLFWGLFGKKFLMPYKKIFFKNIGIEYFDGLFYTSDLEKVAHNFSNGSFRVDDMVRGKCKGYQFTLFDCIDGVQHNVFLAIKVEKRFSSQTLIETKSFLKNSFFEGSKVNLEDIEFSKVYNVFSQDQVEARYLLTPSFIERILKYNQQKNTKAQVLFSNTYSKEYNAFFYIPVNKDWFDFKTYDSDRSSRVWKYYCSECYDFVKELKEIMQVIEALKLDQDIGL